MQTVVVVAVLVGWICCEVTAHACLGIGAKSVSSEFVDLFHTTDLVGYKVVKVFPRYVFSAFSINALIDATFAVALAKADKRQSNNVKRYYYIP